MENNPMRLLRSRLGLSQTALAAEISCNHSRIAHAEAGAPLGRRVILSLLDLYRADCEALGIGAEEFLRGEVRR